MQFGIPNSGRILCLLVLFLGLALELEPTQSEGDEGRRTSFEEVPHNEWLDSDDELFEEAEVFELCHGVTDDSKEWEEVLVLAASNTRDVESESTECRTASPQDVKHTIVAIFPELVSRKVVGGNTQTPPSGSGFGTRSEETIPKKYIVRGLQQERFKLLVVRVKNHKDSTSSTCDSPTCRTAMPSTRSNAVSSLPWTNTATTNQASSSTSSTTTMSEPLQQPPPYGPRTLRFYIRETFRDLNTLEKQQQAHIEAYLTTSTPAPTPIQAPNPNSIRDGANNASNYTGDSRKFLARGNDLERQNLVTFRHRYYSTLTALRDLIDQLPEDKVVARKRYLRHLLMRIDKILGRMNFELSESKAATAAGVDTGAGVALFRGRRNRRYIRGGVDGVGGGGIQHRMILRMHQDVMMQFIRLFRELSTKY
ncbi:hypothetical protein BG015_007990 [Linnemannia schmuckeri]|uniref:Uncharacterized protein n=1 Tax=Linnemannia schmuckeri TaxID=64567 RepID=A0A9P5RXM4_9FUNG|nr:hypothetical protein BG015_007990 [Linnemannia schmuckeri]